MRYEYNFVMIIIRKKMYFKDFQNIKFENEWLHPRIRNIKAIFLNKFSILVYKIQLDQAVIIEYKINKI